MPPVATIACRRRVSAASASRSASGSAARSMAKPATLPTSTAPMSARWSAGVEFGERAALGLQRKPDRRARIGEIDRPAAQHRPPQAVDAGDEARPAQGVGALQRRRRGAAARGATLRQRVAEAHAAAARSNRRGPSAPTRSARVSTPSGVSGTSRQRRLQRGAVGLGQIGEIAGETRDICPAPLGEVRPRLPVENSATVRPCASTATLEHPLGRIEIDGEAPQHAVAPNIEAATIARRRTRRSRGQIGLRGGRGSSQRATLPDPASSAPSSLLLPRTRVGARTAMKDFVRRLGRGEKKGNSPPS